MSEIELQPFERQDFSRLIGWITSEDLIAQWAPALFKYPLDKAQLETYLQAAETEQPTRKIFKAVDQKTLTVVGHIELDRLDLQNRAATISRVLVGEASLRGKGIGRQMIQCLLKIGFQDLELHRISIGVFENNQAGLACYESVGFVKEGYIREAWRKGEEYWSYYILSMLESEWKQNL